MESESPLEQLDQYTAALVVALCFVYAVSYAFYPHVIPSERPGFLPFCTGLPTRTYVRDAKRTPSTSVRWPQTAGTPTYNADVFAASIMEVWDPSKPRPLHKALLRRVSTVYIYTHVMTFCQRMLGLLEPVFYSCVIHYMKPETPHELGYKLLLFSAMRTVLLSVCEQCQANITALTCESPISCGLRLLVLRKIHRLSPAGRAMASAADAHQAVQTAMMLGHSMASWNLKCVLADVFFCFYCIKSMWSQSGFLVLVVYGIMSCMVGSLCTKLFVALSRSVEHMRAAELKRSELLNELLGTFRQRRSYDWLDPVSLDRAMDYETAQQRSASLLMTAANGAMFLGTKLVVPTLYFVSVFIRGEGVSFENGLKMYAHMGLMAFCMHSVGQCVGKWFEIQTRSSWLEAFLRLPEQEDVPQLANGEVSDTECVEIVDGAFAWPPAGKKDSEQAAGETFKANEAALWMVRDGRYAGNWVPCTVEGIDEASGLYTVLVSPTKDFASAGGASGTSVSDVPAGQLRKLVAAVSEVQFRPQAGELILVSGGVGAGKTSLLLALIGEMVRVSGRLQQQRGAVAFQPQAPQLLDGTIRQNVLLGATESQCDEALLQKALVASQLAADMNNPSNTLHATREHTVVGKDGTLLSGGQRARTALARSVYAVLAGAKLAVLDDPVASVDNEVLRSAWEAAVVQAMRGATRVVAVNSQLLKRLAPSADRLVLLEGGRIIFDGPPSAGLERLPGGQSSPTREPESEKSPTTWSSPRWQASEEALAPPAAEAAPGPEAMVASAAAAAAAAALDGSGDHDGDDGPSGESAATGLAQLIGECEPLRKYVEGSADEGGALQLSSAQWESLRARLRDLERGKRHSPTTSKGFIDDMRMVFGFFYNRSAWWFPIAAMIEVISCFESGFTYSTGERWEKGTMGFSDRASMLIFTAELVFFSYCGVFALHCTTLGVTGVGKEMRRRVHHTLTSLGMPFFWRGREQAETDIRRVLNISVHELAVMGKMPTGVLQIATLFAVVISKHPPMLPLVLVSAYLLTMLNAPKEWVAKHLDPQERGITAELEVRFLEHHGCGATLSALGCTSALEAELHPKLMSKSYAAWWRCHVDTYVKMLTLVVSLGFVVSGKFVVMYLKSRGGEGAQAMLFDSMIGGISMAMNMLSMAYIPFLVGVDRFREVHDFLESRYVEDTSGEDPPLEEWPTEGRLLLEDVTFRYLPYAPAALQGVSLEVHPCEKLGIVGRTGAGKSTLVSLLLRLGPLAGLPPKSGGRILLDGRDIGCIRLSRLRRAVALVPQDPVIFKQSLKDNVGPEFSEAEVATALKQCGLDAHQLTGAATLPEALKSELDAGGLSIGQQQLIMAARALVKRPKVMVLDECTASLDVDSANQLLDVVGTHCAEATVLSIAHRLRFVLRCDRILVLANGGQILGLDTPAKLMADQEGYFATCLRHEELDDSQQGG